MAARIRVARERVVKSSGLRGVKSSSEEVAKAESLENVLEIDSMQAATGWRALAKNLFVNVVNETAAAFGVSTKKVVENVNRTWADAGEIEN